MSMRKHLSQNESDVGQHRLSGGHYIHRLYDEMETETRVSVHMVKLAFACVGPFLQFGGMFVGLHHFV